MRQKLYHIKNKHTHTQFTVCLGLANYSLCKESALLCCYFNLVHFTFLSIYTSQMASCLRVRICDNFPFTMLRFCLVYICVGLRHAVTLPVSSYVYHPIVSHSHLALTVFLSPLLCTALGL